MKILFLAIFIFLTMLSINSKVSKANPILIEAGDKIELISYNAVDNAGLMLNNVYKPNGDFIGALGTFCIQDNVYISKGTVNSIASITNQVGIPTNSSWTVSGTPTPIPGTGALNGAVDYLFSLYTNGTYINSMTTPTAEADFQYLLWNLQGSGTKLFSVGSNPWEDDLDIYLNTPSLQNHSYGTKVINVVSAAGVNQQNQLYNFPSSAPEPSTLVLLGLGLISLGTAMKKSKPS